MISYSYVQDDTCMAWRPKSELFSAETGGHGHCCGVMMLLLCASWHHVKVITMAADVVPQLIGHGTHLL